MKRHTLKHLLALMALFVAMALPFGLLANFAQADNATLTRSPWQMLRSPSIVTDVSPYPAYHGDPILYNFAPPMPASNNPNWGPAPDPNIIDFHSVSRLSVCLQNEADFSFFQTFVSIPSNTQLNTASITFSDTDDGAEVTIFNSSYPNGLVKPGVLLGQTSTQDVAQYLVAGETNRIVITQVDDCPVGNNLGYAAVVLNGTTVKLGPPVVAANNGSVTVNEGQTATNTGTFSDPNGYAVTLSASVGAVTVTGPGAWSWSFPTTDGPSQSQTVTITANDGNGGITDATFPLVVNNVAPTVTPPSSQSANEGVSQTLSTGSFSDPGINDFPWSVDVSWGDSSPDTLFTTNSLGLLAGQNHAYPDEGSYTLKVSVTDKDGGVGSATSAITVADASLTAGPAQTITSTEAVVFSGSVGSFTDANPTATSADFTASIAWGDSSTSAGTISGSAGSFTVAGSHTYADEGSYAVSVTVTDDGGSAATLTGTANVADASLTAGTAQTITPTEGLSFSGSVGSFTDANPTATSADFTASIAWGDSLTSTGTISGSAGSFTVAGSHTYADEGIYTVSVTVTDDGGSTATLTGTANVADASLTAGPAQTITSTEAVVFSGSVGSFTDANPTATSADFTASIAWGDSLTSTGTISGSAGSFTVAGSHTYADEGIYTVSVTVTDDGGSAATLTGTAKVGDASLAASPATPPNSYINYVSPVATFTDSNPGATKDDFTVAINWGDSFSSAGVVTGPTGGPFTVTGTHTYMSTGYFTITVTINDDGGSKATTSSKVLVYAFAPGGGSFVIGDKESAIGNAVTFWGAQWSGINKLTSGSAPSSFKGFAESPATPVSGTTWSADPGNSTPPPQGALPAYMGVIVTTKATKSGPSLTGDTLKIVIVQTNPGYDANPGHAGTGTVIQQAN